MNDRPDLVSRTVALLAPMEVAPATLFGLYEVFSSVGHPLQGEERTRSGVPPFEVWIVGEQDGTFTGSCGFPIAPHRSLAGTGRADIVIVGDLLLSEDLDPLSRWPAFADWIAERYRDGSILCSACTGALLLAASGLLDGQPATSHWTAEDLMGRCFPDVIFEPAHILLPTGPDQRLITAGGAASWEDLALYLIARTRGKAEAIRIAKLFLFGDRGDGQLAYAGAPPVRRHDDRIIGDSQVWLADNYQGRNPVAGMIKRSGLAERTFKRRFQKATGRTPMDYVQILRVEEAKQLLETSDQGTDQIGALVGYEDPTFFRRLFKRRTGITPARYRQKFKAIGRVVGDPATILPPKGRAKQK